MVFTTLAAQFKTANGGLSPIVVAKVSICVVSIVETFKGAGGWSRLHVSCVHSIASTTVVLLSFSVVEASKEESIYSSS